MTTKTKESTNNAPKEVYLHDPHKYGQVKDYVPITYKQVGFTFCTANNQTCNMYNSRLIPALEHNGKIFELDIDELVDLATVAGLFDDEVVQDD